MTAPENLLVCSTVGKIYALNKMIKSMSGYGVYLVALKLDNGAEVWRNPLKGMGYSKVSVLVINPNSAESHGTQRSIVIVASSGKVCGIGIRTRKDPLEKRFEGWWL